MSEEVAGADLLDVVDLAELLAERVNFGAGDTRIELVLKDGVLRYAYLHQGALDRHELRRRYPAS